MFEDKEASKTRDDEGDEYDQGFAEAWDAMTDFTIDRLLEMRETADSYAGYPELRGSH